MKIEVDMALCRGYAICVGLAPEYFQIDDKGDLDLITADVEPADEENVRESAMVCPMQAILVHEDAA